MRIIPVSQASTAANASASAPAPAASVPVEPGVSKEQFESLENIARSLLQKLERVEERLNALEGAPAQREQPATIVSFPVISVSEPAAPSEPEITSKAAPVPEKASTSTPTPAAPIPAKVESVKKDLFYKMWKYMNDESAKAV